MMMTRHGRTNPSNQTVLSHTRSFKPNAPEEIWHLNSPPLPRPSRFATIDNMVGFSVNFFIL